MIRLSKEEEELLQMICDKHQVKKEHLLELINIEHRYSIQSSAKRRGLKDELTEKIDNWIGDHSS